MASRALAVLLAALGAAYSSSVGLTEPPHGGQLALLVGAALCAAALAAIQEGSDAAPTLRPQKKSFESALCGSR
ncbi:MAG TPA: hypothetical protein VGL46_05070 [Pseudonocardiaceae bacterium]